MKNIVASDIAGDKKRCLAVSLISAGITAGDDASDRPAETASTAFYRDIRLSII